MQLILKSQSQMEARKGINKCKELVLLSLDGLRMWDFFIGIG